MKTSKGGIIIHVINLLSLIFLTTGCNLLIYDNLVNVDGQNRYLIFDEPATGLRPTHYEAYMIFSVDGDTLADSTLAHVYLGATPYEPDSSSILIEFALDSLSLVAFRVRSVRYVEAKDTLVYSPFTPRTKFYIAVPDSIGY